MRWTTFVVAVAMLVGLRSYGQVSADSATKESLPATPDFSLKVVGPSQPVRMGSPIPVSVTVKNVSNKEIQWRSEFADTAYQAFHFQLTQNGQEMEKTPFHRRVRGEQRPGDPAAVESGSSIVSPVSAGKSFSFSIDLTRLYQIKTPGQYTLRVSRLDDSDGGAIVFSNAVTVTVAP